MRKIYCHERKQNMLVVEKDSYSKCVKMSLTYVYLHFIFDENYGFLNSFLKEIVYKIKINIISKKGDNKRFELKKKTYFYSIEHL